MSSSLLASRGRLSLAVLGALALLGIAGCMNTPRESFPATPLPAAASPAPSVVGALGGVPAADVVASAAPAARPLRAEPARPTDPTPMLLAYAERVRSFAAPELAAEIVRLNDSANADDPVGQIELSLALLQTRLAPDTARAVGLLQKALGSNSAIGQQTQPLARLLVARALDQRRLEELVDRQNQQARDAQRRIDQLNERLEAMRAIERSITSRPGAAPAAANSRVASEPAR